MITGNVRLRRPEAALKSWGRSRGGLSRGGQNRGGCRGRIPALESEGNGKAMGSGFDNLIPRQLSSYPVPLQVEEVYGKTRAV